jgi:malonyl-CoA O-methyltransferase
MNPKEDNSALNSKDVQRRFDRAAARFDSVDFVHAATRDGLLARLEPMTVEAKTIIDLGSATGSGSRLLARRFRRARVTAVDLSRNMLEQGRKKQGWFSRVCTVQANAEALPFADQTVDVVFANMLLPWMSNPARTFAEISRVLRKDGLFLFATLGPDSLDGLRHEPFADMHDVGDALVRAGLRDPVLDVDRLAVTYESTESLLNDLTAMGAGCCAPDEIGVLGFDLELVYGHCWGSGRRLAGGEYRVAASRIGRRTR